MMDMTKEHANEILADAFTAYARADFDTDPAAFVRAESRLLDACVAAGMDYAEPAMEEWAADRVAKWWA